MSERRSPRASGLDVYLFPAVVGGGLGDIEEVLLAGRRLERAGFLPILFRRPGTPLPRSVPGPWGWPRVRRVDRVAPRSPRALTLSAWWGVCAAPPSDRPFGRPGPWAEEAAEIERVYGPDRVLHVSFEEFARTLTSREQTGERWREGGVAVREIRRRLRDGRHEAEIQEFRAAFERFRGFDRPDVLHLYPTFARSRTFAREFPRAVQTGPFWPEPPPSRRTSDPRRWIWYASPSSSPLLASQIARAWSPRRPSVTIEVRAPTRFPLPSAPGLRWRWIPPLSYPAWHRRFATAGVRIVTGSRTLLEALVVGGPFLYFNGVTGTGRGARRHRPEKIDNLLRAWKRARVSPRLRTDLADFSRLRAVRRVVDRARSDPAWSRAFPQRHPPRGFRPPFDDAGALVEGVARTFAEGTMGASELVARVRAGRLSPLRRPA
ncbi:MAG TPA: hypothetical protein VGV89_10735 [Thermoplasmata archaeon]|nr:hypothetical protein [Thermoplasmata archaeon]